MRQRLHAPTRRSVSSRIQLLSIARVGRASLYPVSKDRDLRIRQFAAGGRKRGNAESMPKIAFTNRLFSALPGSSAGPEAPPFPHPARLSSARPPRAVGPGVAIQAALDQQRAHLRLEEVTSIRCGRRSHSRSSPGSAPSTLPRSQVHACSPTPVPARVSVLSAWLPIREYHARRCRYRRDRTRADRRRGSESACPTDDGHH